MPKKKQVTELRNVQVHEVSLVKRGAVPRSRFVICKRADGEDAELEELPTIEELTKSITAGEGYSTAHCLMLLASMTELASSLAYCKMDLPDDIKEQVTALQSALLDIVEPEPIEKEETQVVEEPAQEEAVEPATEEEPAAEEVVEVPEPSEPVVTGEGVEAPEVVESATEEEIPESPEPVDIVAEAARFFAEEREEKVQTETDLVLSALRGLRDEFQVIQTSTAELVGSLTDRFERESGLNQE